jgi:predicted acyl esterase
MGVDVGAGDGRRRIAAVVLAGATGLAMLGTSAAPAWGASSTSPGGRGGIGDAYVVGATPGQRLAVVDSAGKTVGSGVVDSLGGLIVRNLAPGGGYRFERSGHRPGAPFSVLSATSTPPSSFYSAQHLHAGLNYVHMRDGVTLAATVRLPPGKSLADGPFPTVIEYSGYATAAPHSLIDALEGRTSGTDPLLPDTATVVGSVVAPLLGFATVSVQMRGTGCSGGAFDLFGLDSDYDGYDVVQAVGAQPWVLHHKVGMVGISYSGISQFEVAGTDPPDLAAIAPLSSTDDLFSTGYPGGIYNDGFAAGWVAQRISDAKAAPGGGQPWASAEIAAGDTTCLANQRLHPEAQQLESLIGPGLSRDPALFDQRSPAMWASHVKVPVFLVGALEDEQTGPQWPALITALRADRTVYVTMLNGTHIDSLGPDTLSRWVEFLDIYVAARVPTTSPLLSALAPAVYSQATGGAKSTVPPPVRFTTAPSVAAARSAFASQDPRVRVLFDNGGGDLGPGAMQPTFEADYAAWPPSGSVTRYFLGSGGTLGARPGTSGSASFEPDPAARPATDLPTGNAWAAQPPYRWTVVPAHDGIGFETAPFTSDTTVVGPASLDLWLRSTAPVTDLQVTVTEVRPGAGQEEYVTSGFLRSDNRTLTAASTGLDPVPTYRHADHQNLPSGRATLVRIPVDPIAHAFRAGTKLRIVISAPGGDRPSWAFDTFRTGGSVTDTVSLGGTEASSLTVDVVHGVTPTTGLPACGALRGEPCRPYAALANQR